MNSDYDVRLATLEAMGGDASKNYPSVYDVDLAILEAVEQGGGGGIPDAPSDHKLYGREDGEWSEVVIPAPGISDAPSDDKYYARRNATWSEVPSGGGISDAPSDSKLYARENAAWVEVPAPGISDAASDNKLYGRKNGAWNEVVIPSPGISDAPSDNKLYGRSNAAWSEVVIPSLVGYATETWVGQQGYLTSVPSNYVKYASVTQAQYDALVQAGTVDAGTLYIISDAQ